MTNEVNNGYDMSYAEKNTADVNYLFPPKREFSAREKRFAWIFAFAGFLFVRTACVPAFGRSRLGLGAAVTLIIISVCSVLFTKKRSALHIFRTVLAVVFSANIFFTANLLIQILSGIFAVLVLIYDSISVSGKFSSAIRPQFVSDMAQALLVPLTKLGEFFGAYKVEKGFGKTLKNVFLGIIIAVPATFVSGALLADADERFAYIVSEIFDIGLTKIAADIFYFIIGFPAAVYILASAVISSKNEFGENDISAPKGFLPSFVGTVSVIPVCVMYVIFFFSQLSYHLAAFENLLPEGAASYSDYARDGFFQLCGAAVINLLMIISVNVCCVKNNEKTAVSIKIVSVILSVFTIALIVTAMSKMMLYIGTYGLTRLRFYTSWFMVLLAFVFGGIIAASIGKINLARFIVYTFTVMFAFLAFCRSDAIIAEYNFAKAAKGEITLHYYVECLSEDCVPAVIKYSHDPALAEYSVNFTDYRAHFLDNLYVSKKDGADDITLSEIIAEDMLWTEQRQQTA